MISPIRGTLPGGVVTVEFLVTALVVNAIPGTGVAYMLAAGLSGGIRGGALGALGCALGLVPHAVIAFTGLAMLLHGNEVAFRVVKAVGAVYLLYMAWIAWRGEGLLAVRREAAPASAIQVIGSGCLVNVLNPKMALFFLAFLPGYLGRDGSAVRVLVLSAVFVLLNFVVFTAYGALAALVRDRVLARPRVLAWLRRAFVAGFVGLCARLVLLPG